ncbi:MAG: hypothetical protein WDO68_16285 [Gammaproteobacteria bacterium]
MRLAGRLWHALRSRGALLKRQYALDEREGAFLRAHGVTSAATPGRTIAIECVEDHYYLALFSLLAGEIRQSTGASVDGFITRSLRPSASRFPVGSLKALLFQNWLTDGKWSRLYRACCDQIAFRSSALELGAAELADWRNAWRVWRGLSNRDDVLRIENNGVALGDLIYDSFLRFKPAPTLDPRDIYLLFVIRQALRDVRRCALYFRQHKPALFLTSYTTYVQHGVPARMAVRAGIPVFSFGNFQEIAKRLSVEDVVHPRNPDGYRIGFARLHDRAAALAQAERNLRDRVSGKIDNATAYMRSSAYAESGEPVPDVRGAAVIFLHDFFDSPHCYRWMLFPDFWVWITTTLEIARRIGLKVFVKPHPNQIVASVEVADELRRRFPDVAFLSPSITNRQLAEAGMACGITVYGTVAHELAFLGVPTVGSGDHPHIGFDFCRTSRTLEDYERALRECTREPDRAELRRQSLEFYFMHNLDFTSAELALRERVMRLRARVNAVGHNLPSAEEHRDFTRDILDEPAFGQLIDRLAALVRVPS